MLRAVVMLVMFSVFSVLFYIDGTTGYRKRNFEYYLHQTFQKATNTFSEMNADGKLSPEAWTKFASKQTVNFPEDPEVLPADLKLPMPWPEVLTDYERVKPLQHNLLWQNYSGEKQLNEDAPEKPFDADTIDQQILVFYICLSLSLITLFFLIRTSRRSITASEQLLDTAQGKKIPYSEMKTLDLRKWDTKGIAFIEYHTAEGTKRARIDGLTYGGFKKDRNEPAEQLMRKIRENFSGEIIEYSQVEETPAHEVSQKNP